MKKFLIICAALILTACTVAAPPIVVTPDNGPLPLPGLPACKTVKITEQDGNTLYVPLTEDAVVRLSQDGEALWVTGEAGLNLPDDGIRISGTGYDVEEQIGAGLVGCK